jgi:aminoacrylate hydrolase
MEALKKRYRVLGYDHRGTSRSVRKLTEPHSVEAMAEDIRIVMDAAGVSQAHIIGHAAGGNAGLAFAQCYPKRLGKLVAINSWSRPDPHIARCFEARLALLNNTGKAAYVKAQPIFLYPAGWISENDAKLNEEAVHQIAGFPPKEVMRQRINALLAFDIDASLPKIKAPVLVAASADDMLVPVACSERLAARLANATLDIAPWGGHGFTVTAAEKFNRTLMAFLKN